MQPVTFILIFFVVWWLVFLPTLSLGNQNQHEAGDDRIEGTDPGAPAQTNMKKKLVITTIIALVVTSIYAVVAASGIITLRP